MINVMTTTKLAITEVFASQTQKDSGFTRVSFRRSTTRIRASRGVSNSYTARHPPGPAAEIPVATQSRCWFPPALVHNTSILLLRGADNGKRVEIICKTAHRHTVAVELSSPQTPFNASYSLIQFTGNVDDYYSQSRTGQLVCWWQQRRCAVVIQLLNHRTGPCAPEMPGAKRIHAFGPRY